MNIFDKDRKWTMEEKIPRYQNMFKSERLEYKSIEEGDDACLNFFVKLFADPAIKGLSEFGALKPPTKKSAQELITVLATKPALAVLICLPASQDGEEKAESTPIGFIGLSSRWEKGFGVALSIATEYQNKGYGREAINWAIDWGFLWGGAHRINIGTIAFNTRAAKLYESIGFIPEGRVRSAAWNDGQWHDLLEFSILDHEWKKLRNIE